MRYNIEVCHVLHHLLLSPTDQVTKAAISGAIALKFFLVEHGSDEKLLLRAGVEPAT